MRTPAPCLLLLLLATTLEAAAEDASPLERVAEASPLPGAGSAVSFTNDILPLLSSRGCNATACHGATGGRGQFSLSPFGADAGHDFSAITREAEGRRINRVEPLQSLLLLKATGSVEHGGQQRIPPGSPEYQLLASWLAAGAPADAADQPRLVAVQVSPESHTLNRGETLSLSATASFSDGTQRDITRVARYQSTAANIATAKEPGRVEARDFGQAYVLVTYNRYSTVARIVVPQPLASPFPTSEVHNPIDKLVLGKLQELGIPPSPLASDGKFLRRVYLDVIGTLPKPQEVREFLANQDPRKRSKLIQRLLAREEFADYWALKWGDLLRIKAEYPSNLWPNAVQAYHAWLRDSIASNKPYDQFVRELLVSSGSNFRDAPANYYRALKKRDPQGFGEATALVFMGARLDCAGCHGHPTESWTLDDNLGMAAFFSQITFKSTKEWKEEIVYLDPSRSFLDPRTKQPIAPKFLDGETPKLAPGEDPRVRFAQWLTAPENPWFARNIVNRIWYWLLGRGIVHEPDDLRPTNPPSNPELLAYLEQELVAHQFDLKHIYQLILNSATYQRSSASSEANASDTTFFSHYTTRRLTAEELSDAIGQVTQVWDEFSSQIPEPYSRWPQGFRATEMPDGSVGTPFLELFGRPPRDTAYESDRDCRPSMRQELFMITSPQLESKVARSPRIKRWLKEDVASEAVIDEMFVLTLARLPSEEEKKKAMEHLKTTPQERPQAMQDLLWALLNTKEFMFNH